MTCRKAAYWQQLYIHGQLERVRIARLEQHLAQCAACRQELTLLEHIRDSVSDRELISEPAIFTQRILDLVAALEARRAVRAQEWLPGVARWRSAGAASSSRWLCSRRWRCCNRGRSRPSRRPISPRRLGVHPPDDARPRFESSWGVWAAGAVAGGSLTSGSSARMPPPAGAAPSRAGCRNCPSSANAPHSRDEARSPMSSRTCPGDRPWARNKPPAPNRCWPSPKAVGRTRHPQSCPGRTIRPITQRERARRRLANDIAATLRDLQPGSASLWAAPLLVLTQRRA